MQTYYSINIRKVINTYMRKITNTYLINTYMRKIQKNTNTNTYKKYKYKYIHEEDHQYIDLLDQISKDKY